MSGFSRRNFLGTSALAAGLAGASHSALGADDQDKDGDKVIPPEAAERGEKGLDLPTFKFELGKSPKHHVVGGNFARVATVHQLPISRGIAGVLMTLEPGGMREFHWHITADEWALILDGHIRVSIVDPLGRQETVEFGPGDVWYFPRGHGHYLQCLGPEAANFLLIFNDGDFEPGTMSSTDWFSRLPRPLLAKNLGVAEADLDGLVDRQHYFSSNPVPPRACPPPISGETRPSPLTHRFELLKSEPHSVHKGGREWRLGADRFPISTGTTGVVLDLDPGALRELHWHPNADEWQYVIDGDVSVTMFGGHGRYRTEELHKGDVGYIPMGYGHSIENVGTTPARMVLGFNTGHYQAVDVSSWLAGNPPYAVSDNFGFSDATAARLPQDRVFIAPKAGAPRTLEGHDELGTRG